LKKKNI
jgi:hypothetical protein